MSKSRTFFKYLFGPPIHQILRRGSRRRPYSENTLESWTGKILNCFHVTSSVLLTFSPIVIATMYSRGYFTYEGLVWTIDKLLIVLVILGPTYLFRAVGRYLNLDYRRFMVALIEAETSSDARASLHQFDVDARHLPADYVANTVKCNQLEPRFRDPNLLMKALFSGFVNTIGIRMVYPGCADLMNYIIRPSLLPAREKWLVKRQADKIVLGTSSGLKISSCVVDRRDRDDDGPRRDTMILCCEGNAGFWEIGCMDVAYSNGYSVIGWNHPGFAGSSGKPFPSSEREAVEAVFLYVRDVLKFRHIRVFAWSIGGYSASWIASAYSSDIESMLLDATFDHIFELSHNIFPESLRSLAYTGIQTYFDLSVSHFVEQYSGPVRFIRRTQDEVIQTGGAAALHSNRGNFLLAKCLTHRYPHLICERSIDELQNWLADKKAPRAMEECYELTAHDRNMARKAILECDKYPSGFGSDLTDDNERTRALLLMASIYLIDFDHSHVQPLPKHLLCFHGDEPETEPIFETAS